MFHMLCNGYHIHCHLKRAILKINLTLKELNHSYPMLLKCTIMILMCLDFIDIINFTQYGYILKSILNLIYNICVLTQHVITLLTKKMSGPKGHVNKGDCAVIIAKTHLSSSAAHTPSATVSPSTRAWRNTPLNGTSSATTSTGGKN